MASKTNLITKRFGTRYGRTVKEKLAKVETGARKNYKCPYCSAIKVKKQVAGVWKCGKCNKVFTGRAFSAESDVKKA